MSGASERVNGRASGLVLQSVFLDDLAHSALSSTPRKTLRFTRRRTRRLFFLVHPGLFQRRPVYDAPFSTTPLSNRFSFARLPFKRRPIRTSSLEVNGPHLTNERTASTINTRTFLVNRQLYFRILYFIRPATTPTPHFLPLFGRRPCF